MAKRVVQLKDRQGNEIYPIAYSTIDYFYPVGSYYETSDANFDPNVSWYGTWVLDSEGKVTVSQDNGTFATVGDTGGEESHTLTVAEIPSHHHDLRVLGDSNGQGEISMNYGVKLDTYNPKPSIATFDTGDGGAHNNLQPYIVVKRWHRIK